MDARLSKVGSSRADLEKELGYDLLARVGRLGFEHLRLYSLMGL